MKFLLWLAIGFLVIWLLRSKKPHVNTGAAKRESAGSDQRDTAEPMVRCMQCGLYLPASEVVLNASGDIFCCEEHRSKQFSA